MRTNGASPGKCSPRTTKTGKHITESQGTATSRHSGEDGRVEAGGRRMRGRVAAASLSAAILVLLASAVSILGPFQQQRSPVGASTATAGSDTVEGLYSMDAGVDVNGFAGEGSVLGLMASSSSSMSMMRDMDVDVMAGGVVKHTPVRYRRGLLFNANGHLRGRKAAPKTGQAPAAKLPGGEQALLNDFNKEILDYLDLDDVQEGHLWIPVAVNKFDTATTDPLVKMCQVNYAKYSEAPWLLPMGGLLSIASGCAELKRDTVQIMRVSTLKRVLEEGRVPVTPPSGFIFHETRCGSTLVANMLASIQTNVMWSESTGPWKVMHTCPKCKKEQIVPWLKVIMDAMTRSARHNYFYFKFQSSEDIEAVTAAFPETPWIFIFREPIEVMMSRLGAQRIGMEGMEKEVTARVEKGMKVTKTIKPKGGNRAKETKTASQLSGLCKKAITAFEANPGKGMMVEYPHLPDGIITTVLPHHYKVEVSESEKARMMATTRMYSKVGSFGKGEATDSKFTEDTSTKHDAASVAVQEAAQRLLYPDFYKLRSLSTWPAYQSE